MNKIVQIVFVFFLVCCSEDHLNYKRELILSLGNKEEINLGYPDMSVTIQYSELKGIVIPSTCPSTVHCIGGPQLTSNSLVIIKLLQDAYELPIVFDQVAIFEKSPLPFKISGHLYFISIAEIIDDNFIKILLYEDQ